MQRQICLSFIQIPGPYWANISEFRDTSSQIRTYQKLIKKSKRVGKNYFLVKDFELWAWQASEVCHSYVHCTGNIRQKRKKNCRWQNEVYFKTIEDPQCSKTSWKCSFFTDPDPALRSSLLRSVQQGRRGGGGDGPVGGDIFFTVSSKVMVELEGMDLSSSETCPLSLAREITPRSDKLRSQGRGELLVSLCHQVTLCQGQPHCTNQSEDTLLSFLSSQRRAGWPWSFWRRGTCPRWTSQASQVLKSIPISLYRPQWILFIILL